MTPDSLFTVQVHDMNHNGSLYAQLDVGIPLHQATEPQAHFEDQTDGAINITLSVHSVSIIHAD